MWKLIWGGGSRTPFTPLELRILQELEQHLEEEARRLFAEQCKCVTLVQRHDREVLCYARVRGKVHHEDPAISFVNQSEDVKLATTRYVLADCRGEGCLAAWSGS